MAVKFQDYYEILGLDRSASQEDIQSAYRKLARKYHPDINKTQEAEEKFKKIGEAYEVLKDPEKRKRYDQLGANWQQGDDFSPPPGWDWAAGGRGGGGGFSNFEGFNPFGGGGGGFSDFFESIFGDAFGGFGRTTERGGSSGGFTGAEDIFGAGRRAENLDQNAEVNITLEDAYFGGKKTLTLSESVPTNRGSQTRQRNYEVTIPAGVQDGRRLRLAGQGMQSNTTGKRGDLYLTLHILPHRQFRVQGADLEVDLPISPWEAALGAKVDVPIVGGKASVTIPAGTQSGKKLRLRDKGLKAKGEGRGSLFAVIKVVVPERLSKRERELFEELSRESKFKPRG
jgi:curved DNA-binding protein